MSLTAHRVIQYMVIITLCTLAGGGVLVLEGSAGEGGGRAQDRDGYRTGRVLEL